MTLKTIIPFLLIFSVIGCKSNIHKTEKSTTSEMATNGPAHIIDWVKALNDNNLQGIEQNYAVNAIKVISADSIISNSRRIAEYYGMQKAKITAIESLFKVEANSNRQISYELIKYKTEDLKEYVQLLIWRIEGQKIIRAFEFTQESNSRSRKVDTSAISQRRKLWIELCNENDAEKLVQQLYSQNTIYFNHKPIVKGVDAVIKEYAYMNNVNYSLNLQPIKLEVVNESLAYEIGQCSGSYNGNYILVWEKDTEGHWKIIVDSNI